jgi:hypothetical protein
MKSVFYVGAALMIGASIYGFVDYKKTIRNEQFKSMYEKEKTALVPVTVVPGETPIAKATGVDIRIPPPVKNVNKEKGATHKITAKERGEKTANSKEIKKRKKLEAELFSRAPLRDIPEINETPKVEKVKPGKDIN